MATICQNCGGIGYPELLVSCFVCQISAEHRYCLDETQIEENEDFIKWTCYECLQKASNIDSRLSLDKTKDKTRRHNVREGHAAAISLKRRCKDRKCCSLKKAEKLSFSRQPHSEDIKKGRECSLTKVEENRGAASLEKRCNYNDCSLGKPEKPLIPTYPQNESSSREGDGSLQTVEKEKILVSFTAEKRKQQRRLILADDDGSDEESTYAKTGWDHKGGEATTVNAVAMRKPVGSSSSGGDTGCAVERLQSIVGASEPMFQASDICNPSLNISYHQLASNCHNYGHAQPIIYPLWRGCFNICNSTYGMIVAHLSNKACLRVSEGANMLPPVLFAEKLQRTSAWPKAFKSSPPTDDHIGLYFLPESDGGVLLDQLVCEINDRDLVLKVLVGELELLIFSSQLLPLEDSTFQGKYYLWGVFRARQMQLPNTDEVVSNNSIDKVLAPSLSLVENQEKNLPMEPWSSSPQKNHANDRQSLEKQFDCRNESDDAVEALDMSLSMMGTPVIITDDVEVEQDCAELELFPLAVEDMAVTARMGGISGFALDLGLGRPTSDGGSITSRTKPDSLALDKAIF